MTYLGEEFAMRGLGGRRKLYPSFNLILVCCFELFYLQLSSEIILKCCFIKEYPIGYLISSLLPLPIHVEERVTGDQTFSSPCQYFMNILVKTLFKLKVYLVKVKRNIPSC